MPINDNDPVAREISSSAPGAYGHAALLLVESLIHTLCDKAALSVDESVEIVQRAIDVQFEHAEAEAADGAAGPMWQAHALLSSIAVSLKIDDDDAPASPRAVT